MYDSHKIMISDLFAYSISIYKLNISLYLYKNFKDYVFAAKSDVLEAIISTFHSQKDEKHFPYVDEILFILKKFIEFIDYDMAFDLINVIEFLATKSSDENFLAYT